MAFKRRITVIELFVQTILKCYNHLRLKGIIPNLSQKDLTKHLNTFDDLCNPGKPLLKVIMNFNENNLNKYDSLVQSYLDQRILAEDTKYMSQVAEAQYKVGSRTKTKSIHPHYQKKMEMAIHQIRGKSKCTDLFKNVEILHQKNEEGGIDEPFEMDESEFMKQKSLRIKLN